MIMLNWLSDKRNKTIFTLFQAAIFICVVVSLTGCGTTPKHVYRTYEGPARSPNQVGMIFSFSYKKLGVSGINWQGAPWIDSNGVAKAGEKFRGIFDGTIEVLPGRYKVCLANGEFVTIDIKAGECYCYRSAKLHRNANYQITGTTYEFRKGSCSGWTSSSYASIQYYDDSKWKLDKRSVTRKGDKWKYSYSEDGTEYFVMWHTPAKLKKAVEYELKNRRVLWVKEWNKNGKLIRNE